MEVVTIELYQANEAADAYAIQLRGAPAKSWKAQRGFGQAFEKCWSVEVQSSTHPPDWERIDWETVLDRVIEASELSDPILTNFEWPILQGA